ncbi:hypothetical protein L211DRAFT_848030 [Terfezia boudieri ATCC MYA-4762]|uniref:Uncharacterized protein n=1 Tax=Terfezia boudieri ATCC MYA-4762 TaxID=1051890 RepID=A0A3N4M6F7_9PEZI|nr:hypothetical protein L211DRAFT_848030 [Terfezia boudieri ATCC MYA-4762]
MTRKSSNQQAGMESRKRAASQTIAPPTTTKRSAPAQLRNEISFNDDIDDLDEIDNEGDRSSSESDEDENETSTPTSVLAPGIGKWTRAFAGIPGIHQGITNVARKIVEQYTLYKKPLLTPGEILLLIQNAWARAQIESRYLERVPAVDCYLKSIHTRTRAHLVAECRFHIMKIYGINHLSKEEMKQKIEYLLDGDRFICKRAKRDDVEDMGKSWTMGTRTDPHVKIVEIEPTNTPQPEDQEKYEAELEKELNHSYDRLNVPESKRKHQRGQLRDSSVEMAEPLQPNLGDIYVDPDQTSDEHSDEEGGENEDESGR